MMDEHKPEGDNSTESSEPKGVDGEFGHHQQQILRNVRKQSTPNVAVIRKHSNQNSDGALLKDVDELRRHMELMHDRCITRNLQAAGLGGLDPQQEKLIYGNLDANARMITGETLLNAVVLHIKEMDKQHHYVTILLNEGADPNSVDEKGRTPLMQACLLGCDKAAKVLLRNQTTDITRHDDFGNTALMYAAATGRDKILKSYVKALNKLEKRYTTKKSGMSADAENHFERLFVEDTLEAQNEKGSTAQDWAVENEHYDCVHILESEKQRRAKALQKKLIALNHEKRRNSSNVQSAKESLKRYQRNFGSFDAIFDEREDKSDEELVEKEGLPSNDMARKLSTTFSSNPNLYAAYLQINQRRASTLSPNPIMFERDIGKFQFDDLYPRARPQARVSMQFETQHPKATLTKSYTEGSLTSLVPNPSAIPPPPSAEKKTIGQKLANILRRRSRQNVLTVESQPNVTAHVGGENAPCKVDLLRKGNSQPELLRRMSRDVIQLPSEHIKVPISGGRHRRSIDINMSKHNSYLSSSSPAYQNNTLEVPNLMATAVAYQKSNSHDSDVEPAPDIDFSFEKTHNPLKSRSSLPPMMNSHFSTRQKRLALDSISSMCSDTFN